MTPNPVQDEPDRAMQRLRNPHHGLKEKLRALTLLYEQQKQASQALKNPSLRPQEQNNEKEQRKTESVIMRENKMHNFPNSTVTRTFVLPQPPRHDDDDAKENMVVVGADRIVGFSCQRKASTTTTATTVSGSGSDSGWNSVARKLSMGAVAPPLVAEERVVEAGSEKQGGKVGSRILVFVRLRPMNKKEKEAGSRCCVRIVNRRDVYLTEFANENDYLRLNRIRGRHFTFDAAFPDSATQQEVYSTTLVSFFVMEFQ